MYNSQLVPNLLPETELLLCCTRTRISSPIADRVQCLLQQQIAWSYLLSMAEKHRVLPLLYHNLKGVCPGAIPAEIVSTLKTRFLENTRENLILTTELLRLLTVFEANAIAVIPYKGTLLAASIYGKTAFRQVWDIDLLVDEVDFSQSRSLLLSEGYTLKETNDREQSFFHADRKIEVDLHWGLTPFYFPVDLDFGRLWSRTKGYTLLGTEVKSFCEEDLLLILCLQVAKDSWERRLHLEHLAKVCDIAELLNHYPRLNWSEVTDQARQQGLTRVLHFCLYLAKNLLDADIPSGIWSEVIGDLIAISLAHQVCKGLFGDIDRSFADSRNSLFDLQFRLKQVIFYLKMRERPRDWWNHFLEIGRNGLTLLKSRGIISAKQDSA
ncbi:nucleotidyltransferase family protein [Dolichospermum sp. UHCC 0259]|uniref:nucleotidyltransferase domain-containing protein n=1 Tax=Dolichospermum sp. UHCC 0259 TaxID=2590010 RepID=UPI00352A0EBF